MAQGTYRVGKVIHCSIGGTTLNITTSSVNRSVDTVDVTNAESGGYQEIEGSIYRASGSLSCVYKGASPPAVGLGTEAALVVLIGANNRFACSAVVTAVNDQSAVAGEFTVSFDWVSSGTFQTYTPA